MHGRWHRIDRPLPYARTAVVNTSRSLLRRRAVRQRYKDGADLIKITATGGVLSQQARGLEAHFTDEEMRAIVDTAHSLGLRVAAHAHGARGIEAAAQRHADDRMGYFITAQKLEQQALVRRPLDELEVAEVEGVDRLV